MPTIIGSKSGTRPYLELDWSVNSQDIANNRSSVNLKLYLRVTHSIGYSARYTGTLYGASFTSSSGYISSPGRYLLTQRDVWIGHNSDGSKTQRLTADYNLNITWSGVYHGKISLSGDANLGTIPRASTLSAFSFASHLKPSTAVTINYTVDRKSGNFRHQLQLRDGSHTVQTWDNISSNGASAVTLSTASVNSLLNRMSSVTSRSLTLRVATRSGVGGGWIGSAVTRNATISVDSTVKPSVGAVSVSQTGNTVSSHYLQGISKVKASFTGSAGYGARITSSSILVRRKTSNTDVQTISGMSGTTSKAVSLSGTYQVEGSITDSRGRKSYTAWAEFTVTAYDSPRITNFVASRSSSTPTTVSISRAGTHTRLGGSNVLTYTVQRRIGTGAWTNVNTNATGTSTATSFSGTSTSTGNAVTSSYEFRMVITDKFGESAESIMTVSTQRVVLDIHKNEGVGIGKIHEKGTLDVDGEIFLRGMLEVDPPTVDNRPILKLNSGENNGFGFVEFFNNVGTRAGYLGVATARDDRDLRNMMTLGADPLLSKGVNFRGSDINFMDMPIMEYGTGGTGSGYYMRFYNGLQVCWGAITVSGTGLTQCNMAATFKDNNYGLSAISLAMASSTNGGVFVTETNIVTGRLIHFKKLLVAGSGQIIRYTADGGARYLAIGMWK